MTLDVVGVGLERLVVDRIEHRDGVAVDVDRVRHAHVAAERPAQAFRDHGLAVSGRPVEEHRLAGVRRPDRAARAPRRRRSGARSPGAAARDRGSRAPPRARASARRRPPAAPAHGPTYWLTSRYCRRAIAAGVGQRVAIARRARSGRRRGLRPAARRAARSMSGSSIVNGSRTRSASDEAGRLAAVERLDQQLLDLVDVLRPVSCERRRHRRRRRRAGLRSSERGRWLLELIGAPSAR